MINRHFLYGILFLSFLILLILPVKPIYGQKANVLRERDVTILFDEGLKPAAEEAGALYPNIRRDLEKNIGWKVDFRPTLILVKDSRTFQRMAVSRLVVAFAVPDRDFMVINYSKMKTDPFTLEATIKHELCHLLLHRNIPGEQLPRWFDEGVAQWVSGGLPDIIMNKRSLLDEAILSGRYLGLKALNKTFPRDDQNIILAYEESKSLIEYIIREYGPDGVLSLLRYLKEGHGMDGAVLKSFSISLDELEKRWYDRIKKRATWLTFLINNLYEILFFLAALILILGFIRVLLKKRSYKDDEEENGDSFLD